MALDPSLEDGSSPTRTVLRLDLTNAGEENMLIKLPPELSRRWGERLRGGSQEPLGLMTMQIDVREPTAPVKRLLTVLGNDGEPEVTYAMKSKSRECCPSMITFLTKPDGNIAVEGTVKDIFHLQRYGSVSDLVEYGAIVSARERRANARPTAKLLMNQPTALSYGFRDRKIEIFKQGKKRKPEEEDAEREREEKPVGRKRKGKHAEPEPMRRISKDSETLERELFTLFEFKPLWKLKELMDELHQPKHTLKNTLRDICDYNQSGQNFGTWCLKPEFKT